MPDDPEDEVEKPSPGICSDSIEQTEPRPVQFGQVIPASPVTLPRRRR